MSFAEVVPLLDETHVVAIVTRRADGSRMVTPIWSVVIDGVPFLRSAFGDSSWWYRHVVAGRETEFVLADGAIAERDKAAALELPTVAVNLEAVPVDDAVQPAIDEALRTKYAAEPENVAPMLSAEAIACTLRVVARA
jgi:hypothetical protein